MSNAALLGRFGSLLAKEHNGGVLALNVIKVSPHFSLSDGRMFLKDGRVPLNRVIEEARAYDVPVHTIIRLGRNVSAAIQKTAIENDSDMILFGWPGTSGTSESLFGSVIDRIIANPPTDIGILRTRRIEKLRTITVPVAGGPNGRLALRTAIALARNSPEPARLILLHVTDEESDAETAELRAQNLFRRTMDGFDYPDGATPDEGREPRGRHPGRQPGKRPYRDWRHS